MSRSMPRVRHRAMVMAIAGVGVLTLMSPEVFGVTAGMFTVLDVPPPIGATSPHPVWQAHSIYPTPAGSTQPIGGDYDMDQSFGTEISDSGMVAVAIRSSAYTPVQFTEGNGMFTYLWQSGGATPFWTIATTTTNTSFMVQNLPSFNSTDHWDYNVVVDLLHNGTVLMGSNTTVNGYKPGNFTRYFVLQNPGTNSGTRTDADVTFTVGPNSYWPGPAAVNVAGTRVGSAEVQFTVAPLTAWTRTGTTDTLVPGTGGNLRSQFTALNERSVTVGWAEYSTDHYQASVYSNGTLTLLGTFTGNTDSFATGINEPGSVIGTSGNGVTNGTGFLYKNGAFTNLGKLAGAADSNPNAINDAGTIVGDSGGTAFLYFNGSLIDLNTLLPGGSGWVLKSANSINNYGQIVGDGLFNGTQRAFLFNLSSSGLSTTLITRDSGTDDINGTNRLASGITSSSSGGIITNSASFPALLRLTNTANQSYSGAIAGNITLVKEGTATQTLTGANTYTGSTIVNAGKLIFNGTASFPPSSAIIINGGELNLGTGIFATTAATLWAGKIVLTGSANGVLDMKILPFLSAGTSIDLTSNKLIVRSTSAADKTNKITSLNATIAAGGITSATVTGDATHYGIGLFDNAILNRTSFGGQPTDTNSIFVAIAHLGDANRNGIVDIQDISIIANNWQQSRNNWAKGDLNRDGIVNIQDSSIIANNWQQTGSYSETASELGGLAGAPPAGAPEPASLVVLGALFPWLLTRRRDRRCVS